MDFHEWVSVAIFPFDFLICLRSALRQKRKSRLIVAKYDRAVVLWVNTAFHTPTTILEITTVVKGLDMVYSYRVINLTKQH